MKRLPLLLTLPVTVALEERSFSAQNVFQINIFPGQILVTNTAFKKAYQGLWIWRWKLQRSHKPRHISSICSVNAQIQHTLQLPLCSYLRLLFVLCLKRGFKSDQINSEEIQLVLFREAFSSADPPMTFVYWLYHTTFSVIHVKLWMSRKCFFYLKFRINNWNTLV